MDYDLVCLGGGLASSSVSRYLALQHPDLRILVLEKNSDTHYNPGESTVGVAGLFMIRDLGLSTYCYLNHLPKCGLRYFFHADDDAFDLTRCSEIGPNILPIIPTFQVDRKRLDRDLWDMNREIGIDVRTGCPVEGLELGRDGELHRIRFQQEGRSHEVEARWVVSALGRNAALNRRFDHASPMTPDPEHRTAAAWARFSGVKDIDRMGSDTWRRKVGYTSRYLSTNHFMGRGYWIWAIPIGGGVVSWGLVYDRDELDETVSGRQGFLDFLRDHRFCAEMLDDAEMLDFQSHPRLAFRRERFCSADRWALIGDAYGFVDPFYSPGTDVIAREAYLLQHLITESDQARLEEKVALVNRYQAFEYELLRLLYLKQYRGFGSYELFNIKSLWDFHSYTNRLVWFFMDRKYAQLNWISKELQNAPRTLGLTRAIQNGFRALGAYLIQQGLEQRHNLDHYSLRQNRFRMEEEILAGYRDGKSISNHLFLCKLTVSELIQARFDIQGFSDHDMAQRALTSTAMVEFELSEAWIRRFCARLARQLSYRLGEVTGSELRFELELGDFSRPVPRSLDDQPDHVKTRIAEVWGKRFSNPVADELIETPTITLA